MNGRRELVAAASNTEISAWIISGLDLNDRPGFLTKLALLACVS